MNRYQVFKFFFSLRRRDLGIVGAARLAIREAFRPIAF